MVYKLIVNAAFLAIGYYIGKQVGLGEQVRRAPAQPGESRSPLDRQQQPGTSSSTT